MYRITSDAFHEKLDTDDAELVLNGPPSDLRGHIFLHNASEDALSIKSLKVIHPKEQEHAWGESSKLRVGIRLNAGEKKLEAISHQLPLQTPPGVYESNLIIGGRERKVKMIVQPYMQVNVHPQNFSFIGAEPGKMHTTQITITNLGNLPFTIPDVKHVAALDMDLLCRAFGFALRSKGGEGYEATLNEIAKNVNRYLPDWASAHIEEAGQTLEPGGTKIVQMKITMPSNTDAGKDYAGSMRFWNKEITYEVKSEQHQSNNK